MNLLRAATLTVRDVAAATARYIEWLDYRLEEAGIVPLDLAASWGCPAGAGRNFATLRPSSEREVFLRFVQADPVADYRPLRNLGWSAIEICVRDVLNVQDRLRVSPFEIIGPAHGTPSLPTIFPMQVRGPDGEIVYLTQILSDLPQYDLPRAESSIDHIFIMVLACSDMTASGAWFEANLGLSPGRSIDMSLPLVSQAFDLPPETRFRLCTMTHGRDVFLELDHYPPGAVIRSETADVLPPGIAIATFLQADLDQLRVSWITPPVSREGPIYGGARAGTLLAPDRTLVELVESR